MTRDVGEGFVGMELTPLRYFRTIAATGHLTRAARELGVTQPALSAMLKKLERELGAPLLHRHGKGVELTEAGRAFLAHAEQAVRHADAGQRSVREVMGLEVGTIRVGGGATAITYLLPPVVSAIRREHPGLRFYIREAGSTQVALAVLSGELDLGIVTLPISIAESDSLVRVPLVEDEMRLIVPEEDSPQRAQRAQKRKEAEKKQESTASAAAGAVIGAGGYFRWKDIAGQPVIGFEGGSAVREVIDTAAAKAGVTLNYVMELRSIESIKEMVSAGIGVGFVSRFALAEGEGLVCRDARLSRRLAIIKRRDRALAPAAAAFERAVTERVGRRLCE